MKDSKSILLVLLSAGLVSTWVYHLYDKTIYSQNLIKVYKMDSAAVIRSFRDSLQKTYSASINNSGSLSDSAKNNTDSLQNQLTSKKDLQLDEIKKLKNDIIDMLNKKSISKEELVIVKQKIIELRQKMDALKTSIMEENKELNDELGQINNEMKELEKNVNRTGGENKSLTGKVGPTSLFAATELRLDPVVVKNNKEQETALANNTSKFVLSFTVQNNITDYKNAEVVVVITQPDGQVLQSGVWDSGSFDIEGGGKKNYTMKMRFESPKGESRHLISSLNSGIYQKGNYAMQVYHNGTLIGQMTKKLN